MMFSQFLLEWQDDVHGRLLYVVMRDREVGCPTNLGEYNKVSPSHHF